MKIKIGLLVTFLLLTQFGFSQSEPEPQPEQKKIKTGWNLGALPSVAYDADLGFQYGVLTNLFHYGDGSQYPDYLHSFFVKIAYTTKKYGLFRFNYDSKYLIPNHRLTVDLSFLPDAMCDFYGYNGYPSVYNPLWHNSKLDNNPDYRSRAFYKFNRNLFRVSGDLQGTIRDNFKWAAGLGLLHYRVSPVNLEHLNKGQKPENQLPDIDELYDKYILWGLLSEKEIKGGGHPYLRGGVIYDSRDRQSNSSKGIYSDLFLTYSAAFGEQKEYNNLKLNAVFQQYHTLFPNRLILAYRAGAQLLLWGDSPFYMDNYLNTLVIQRVLYEAVGGGNSVRGVMRNRVLANGFGYANLELRWQVVHFDIGKQHFYIGLNPFADMGMVLQPNPMDEEQVRANIAAHDPDFDISTLSQYFDWDPKKVYQPHFSAGMGLKIAMNENFILSVDWAMPLNEQDGAKKTNFYIKMGYLF